MKWYKRSGRKKAKVAQVRGELAPPHHLAVLHGQLPAKRRRKPPSLRPLLSLRLRRHRAYKSHASACIGTPRPTRTCPTIQAKCRSNAPCLRGFRAVLRSRHSTTVAHPRRCLGACHSASRYLLCLTQNDSVAGLQALDSPLRLQVDQIYFHYRESELMTENEDRYRKGAKRMPPWPTRLRQKQYRK